MKTVRISSTPRGLHAALRQAFRISAVAAGVASLGCSSPERDDDFGLLDSSLLNCEGALGDAPLQNSCGVGWVGPFGDADGSGDPGTPLIASTVAEASAAPSITRPQVVYRVALPSDGADAGVVGFSPAATQDYSVVTGAELPVEVLDAAGSPVSPTLEQLIGPACDAVGTELGVTSGGGRMEELRVYRLEHGETYSVVLGPSPTAELDVLIDEPNDFVNIYFPDEDDDGFGDFGGLPLVTECVAPSGFVDNADDCDDSSAAAYPGSAEVGVDVDNDCDGVLDGAPVSTDLVAVEATPLDAPTEVVVGLSIDLEVRRTYSNRGTSAVDALVSGDVEASSGLSVEPGAFDLSVPHMMPRRPLTLVETHTVSCDAAGRQSLLIGAEVQPDEMNASDSDPSNNRVEAETEVVCCDYELVLSPATLWPPNHKLVEVNARIEATESCKLPVAMVLRSITSSEPDNGQGDGNTTGDISGAEIGTEDTQFFLRAERSGGGPGRHYTVTYALETELGVQIERSAIVTVPHSSKK